MPNGVKNPGLRKHVWEDELAVISHRPAAVRNVAAYQDARWHGHQILHSVQHDTFRLVLIRKAPDLTHMGWFAHRPAPPHRRVTRTKGL